MIEGLPERLKFEVDQKYPKAKIVAVSDRKFSVW